MSVQTDPASCPFCRQEPILVRGLVAAHLDWYPLNPGHTLIVPRRHVANLWDCTPEEYHQLFELARVISQQAEPQPAGWNLGVNVGSAAGQTVGHVHLHLIPRLAGDVKDPRGGVRWVVAERAAYWEEARP